MRALFTSYPAIGHLLPMMPLARAAAAAGDEVVVSAHADLGALVRDLPFIPAGPSNDELFAASQSRHPSLEYGDVSVQQEAITAMFTTVPADLGYEERLEIARSVGPDVIVAEIYDFVAPLVAAALEIPLVLFSHSPEFMALTDALAGGLRSALDARGLDEPTPRAHVQLWPDWLQPEGHRPAAYELSIGLEPIATPPGDVRGALRPSVLVSLGTVVDDREMLDRVVDAVLRRDVDLLVTAPSGVEPESVYGNEDRVHVVGFTPIDTLLAGQAAVVGVGGSGTTLAALQRGIPLVLMPVIANQPIVADAVAAQGSGVVCDGTEGVSAALGRVLDEPAFADRAAEAAGLLAGPPTPTRTWDALRGRLAG